MAKKTNTKSKTTKTVEEPVNGEPVVMTEQEEVTEVVEEEKEEVLVGEPSEEETAKSNEQDEPVVEPVLTPLDEPEEENKPSRTCIRPLMPKSNVVGARAAQPCIVR